MVKYLENRTVFHFTWDQVVQGFWQRYPNPESAHVLSEDTIAREVRGSKLFSTRLLTKTNRVPKWGERFIGSSATVRIVEESVVDMKEKTLVTYTRNLGYTRVMSLIEKVVYRPSDENPDWTVAERSAWVDSKVLGFGLAIQAFGAERFKKNCIKTVRGFNHVLANLFHKQPTGVSLSMRTSPKKSSGAQAAQHLAPNSLYVSCEPS